MSNNNMDRNSWPEDTIFSMIKVMVLLTKNDLELPIINIIYAQDIFFLTFGYNITDIPIPLNNIISELNNRDDAYFMERALLLGMPTSEFMNLKRKNGCTISCYVTLSCTANVKKIESKNIELDIIDDISVVDSSFQRYGVITIRSASVVGNVKSIGMLVYEPKMLINHDIVDSKVIKNNNVHDTNSNFVINNTQSNASNDNNIITKNNKKKTIKEKKVTISNKKPKIIK